MAARLKAIYGSVSNLDAFVGMMAEKHVTGSELGELQLATWKDQFGAARDGDRFFYLNDPLQSFIRQNFGIDSRKTLAQIIAAEHGRAGGSLPANVFRLPGAPNTPAGLTGASASASASAGGEGAVAVAADSTAPTASVLTRHTPSTGTGAGTARRPAKPRSSPARSAPGASAGAVIASGSVAASGLSPDGPGAASGRDAVRRPTRSSSPAQPGAAPDRRGPRRTAANPAAALLSWR